MVTSMDRLKGGSMTWGGAGWERGSIAGGMLSRRAKIFRLERHWRSKSGRKDSRDSCVCGRRKHMKRRATPRSSGSPTTRIAIRATQHPMNSLQKGLRPYSLISHPPSPIDFLLVARIISLRLRGCDETWLFHILLPPCLPLGGLRNVLALRGHDETLIFWY